MKKWDLTDLKGRVVGNKYTMCYVDYRHALVRKATKHDLKTIKIGEYNPKRIIPWRYVVKEKDGTKWIWDGVMMPGG